jgi:hypothetical protein
MSFAVLPPHASAARWPANEAIVRDLWEYVRRKNNLDDGCLAPFDPAMEGSLFHLFLAMLETYCMRSPGDIMSLFVRIRTNFPARPRVIQAPPPAPSSSARKGESAVGMAAAMMPCSGIGCTLSSLVNLGSLDLVLARALRRCVLRSR